MALLQILRFPDPRLRTRAKPLIQVEAQHRQIIHDMFETMYESKGIGLAATQVNIHWQIIVVDVSAERKQPLCLINPKILASDGTICTEEGCLSVPGVYESVERAEYITVQALNQEGQPFTLNAEEVLAICIQHEMDHLEGKLFVDYLSPLKRQLIRRKMVKQQRQVS